jgi:radical SAM protein with 4Fe4S-binding SPASM domain
MLTLDSSVVFPEKVEISQRGEEFVFWAPDRRVAVKVGAAGAEILDACRDLPTARAVVEWASAGMRLPQERVEPAVMNFLGTMFNTGFLVEQRPMPPLRILEAARFNPIILYLHLSVHCNLSCVYCYNVEHRTTERFSKALTRDEYLALIERAAELGIKQLNLTGGEPMLSPYWIDYAEHAHALGLSLSLLTNGNLINAQNAPIIQRLFSSAIVSLDSPDPEINDQQRGRGSHAKTVAGIKALRNAGFDRFAVRAVVTRRNLPTMKDFPEFAMREWGSARLMPTLYVPNSLEEEKKLQLLPSLDEYQEAMHEFQIALARVGGTGPVKDQGEIEEHIRCGAGAGILSIDFNGDVYPCQALHDPAMKIGNIREDSYFALGERSPVTQAFRQLHVGQVEVCESCNFNSICGGGCRANAFKMYRSLTAYNPEICTFNKANAWDAIWQKLASAPLGGSIDPAAQSGGGCSSCSTCA